MRKFLSSLLLASASFVGSAQAESDISLLSMWATPGERAALYEIIDQAVESDLSWQNLFASHNFNGTRAEFVRLLIADEPPQMVQWVIGRELDELIDQNILQAIPGESLKNAPKFRPEIIKISKHREDSLNSIPIGIHTHNHMVVNKNVWKATGLPLPKTIDDFFNAFPALLQRGVVPVAISNEKWQLRNLMLGLLSVYMTQPQFEHLIHQPDQLSNEHKEAFVKAFSKLRMISKMGNTDTDALAWNEVTYKVVQGDAAAQINADSIGAEISYDDHLVCMTMPGAEYILWTAESLAFVNHSSMTPDVIERVSKVLLSEETHRRYIARKGGIPAIEGIDPKELSACSRQNIRDWDKYKGKRVWLEGDSIRTTLERVGAVSTEFLANESMGVDEAVSKLLQHLGNSTQSH